MQPFGDYYIVLHVLSSQTSRKKKSEVCSLFPPLLLNRMLCKPQQYSFPDTILPKHTDDKLSLNPPDTSPSLLSCQDLAEGSLLLSWTLSVLVRCSWLFFELSCGLCVPSLWALLPLLVAYRPAVLVELLQPLSLPTSCPLLRVFTPWPKRCAGCPWLPDLHFQPDLPRSQVSMSNVLSICDVT